MNGSSFDRIAVSVAAPGSRRRFLAGMAATVAAALRPGTILARRPEMVAVCHKIAGGERVKLINVTRSAAQQHLQHGDVLFNGCCSDPDCDQVKNGSASCIDGTCQVSCDEGFAPRGRTCVCADNLDVDAACAGVCGSVTNACGQSIPCDNVPCNGVGTTCFYGTASECPLFAELCCQPGQYQMLLCAEGCPTDPEHVYCCTPGANCIDDGVVVPPGGAAMGACVYP